VKLQSVSEQSVLPIALDTAGGDRGLEVQVEGALQAWKEFGCKSVLVGPEPELRTILQSQGGANSPLTIVHAPEVITMEDSPTRAIRKKPNSSLCVAYNLVEQGAAAAVLSSGNSGAMMAAGRMVFGLLPGIERPAIATLIPVAGDGLPNVILDSGANVECHAHHLVQFAIMGVVYFESLFGDQPQFSNGASGSEADVKKRPKVALLSNGEEPTKGTDVIRSAYAALAQIPSMNFIGYCEGRDVPGGSKANVIVCDGMVGNVLLKGMEGCVKLFFDQLMHDAKRSPVGRLALWLSKGTYKRVFREKFDYTYYGGAPLLGLRKLAVVLHGSSDSRAVKNAIRITETFVRIRMTARIGNELGQLEDTALFTEDEFFVGTIAKGRFYENGQRRRKTAKAADAVEETEGEA